MPIDVFRRCLLTLKNSKSSTRGGAPSTTHLPRSNYVQPRIGSCLSQVGFNARTMAIFGIVFCALSDASRSIAQEYQSYHPRSPLTLGGGYDPRRPTEPFVVSCIEHDGEEPIDSGAGPSPGNTIGASGNLRTNFVRTQRQLSEAVGFSASAEAHATLFSGSASTSSSTSSTLEEDSLTWVVRQHITFGRFRMKNPRLSVTGRALTGSPEQFFDQCGTHFVAQIERGSSISLVFSVRGLTATQRSSLSAAVSAAYSGAAVGGSAAAAYNQLMQSLQKTAHISLDVVVQGGPGQQVLASLSAVSTTEAISKALADYISATTTQNARPLGFVTAAFQQFGVPAPPSFAAFRNDTIMQIADAYAQVLAAQQRISTDYLRLPTSPRETYLYQLVDDEVRRQMALAYEQYGEVLRMLVAQGRDCVRDAATCRPPAWDRIPRVRFHPIPEAPWGAVLTRCTTHRLRTVGSPPPPAGSVVAFQAWVIGIYGERRLLSKARLNVEGNITEVELRPDYGFPIFSNNDCERQSFDEMAVISYIRLVVDVLHERSQETRVEIEDVFGRVREIHLR